MCVGVEPITDLDRLPGGSRLAKYIFARMGQGTHIRQAGKAEQAKERGEQTMKAKEDP